MEPLALEHFEALLDAASEGVVRCRDGKIHWLSARAISILGAEDASELIGQDFNALFPPTNGEDCAELDRHFFPHDGEECTLRVLPVDTCGEDVFYLIEDVTRVRSLESEVQRANRELHCANRERVALRERVQLEEEERDELLTVISHELRTPITVITGYNRLLLTEKVGVLNEEQKRFCNQSIKSCQRLNNFIANLLEASRESGGEMVLEVKETSLVPTIEGVTSFLRPLLEEHGLQLDFDLHPASSAARFDPVRIEQVITNLLSNSIKYTREGGCIEVGLRNVEVDGRGLVEVFIADDGPGIAEDDRDRIFDPYVRLGDSGHVGGLGLGLALCKRIIEAHGGNIWVGDREGGGSRFCFTLPPAAELAPPQVVTAGGDAS